MQGSSWVLVVLLTYLNSRSTFITNVHADEGTAKMTAEVDVNDNKNLGRNLETELSIINKKKSHVKSKVKVKREIFNGNIVTSNETVIKASSFPPKSQPNYNNNKRQQVLFLHFHKAGGTSICRYFKDSGTWRVPERFCICNERITTHALFSHTRKVIHMRNLDNMFRKSRSDICMLEKKWMQPFYFFQIRRLFPGSIMTALRLPWDRFRSNYEKDYSICSDQQQYKRNSNNKSINNKLTIATYATLNPKDCQKSYYLRTNTNRPNFYVRMLNGLSVEEYYFDGDGEGGLNIMTVYHLEQAKQVLLAFDVVLFLEEDPHIQNMKLQKLTGESENNVLC